MPRDGAIIFSDLIGKPDVLRVTCIKCERAGRYRLDHLIRDRGRNAKIVDWLRELTADCPRMIARNMSDQCGARCPDLPKVLQLSALPRKADICGATWDVRWVVNRLRSSEFALPLPLRRYQLWM